MTSASESTADQLAGSSKKMEHLLQKAEGETPQKREERVLFLEASFAVLQTQ